MAYEKNKTAYHDDAWFKREQRNELDVGNWNPFLESLKPIISDPIDSAPLDGMKPLAAGSLQRAAQIINMTMFNTR